MRGLRPGTVADDLWPLRAPLCETYVRALFDKTGTANLTALGPGCSLKSVSARQHASFNLAMVCLNDVLHTGSQATALVPRPQTTEDMQNMRHIRSGWLRCWAWRFVRRRNGPEHRRRGVGKAVGPSAKPIS